MNCGTCHYPLWNIRERVCPECGTGFRVGDFQFNVNSVQFRCPHCGQAYYGTDPKTGHLVPTHFACVKCSAPIDMEEMILLPTEGISEERTTAWEHPWLERKGSTFKAWAKTLIASCFTPRKLIDATPVESPKRAATGFFLMTLAITLTTGVGGLVLFFMFVVYGMAGPSGGRAAGAAGMLLLPVAVVLALISVWVLSAHGVLRITGKTLGLGRTVQAFAYSGGPIIVAAVPCLGLHLSWIGLLWWMVNATLVVQRAHRISGLRAAASTLLIPVLAITVSASLLISSIASSPIWSFRASSIGRGGASGPVQGGGGGQGAANQGSQHGGTPEAGSGAEPGGAAGGRDGSGGEDPAGDRKGDSPADDAAHPKKEEDGRSGIGVAVMVARRGPSINFDRDIRPILSDACFTCHGPDGGKRKAGLRLDLKDGLFGATRDAEDPDRDPSMPTKVIDREHPEMSELLRRVLSEDSGEVMPPAKAARQITAGEKALLARWVREGAAWSGHWAFEEVREVQPPVVESPWVINEIDRFVLARLAEVEHERGVGWKIEPAPAADRVTLARRLSLDLTGVPPSEDDVAALRDDSSEAAYGRYVDRLLASPRYGEHMALGWLEVARYADSNGFQLDLDRTAWPWRDWVVEAFNTNLPYDRFVIDQLAGDLVGPEVAAATEADTPARRILATAFGRNHPINGEGGRDIEESRIDYVHDRVDATATAFLGLTMSCAQCHDHKYDPISQRDYYSFFAYFNSVDEDGGGDKGDMPPLMDYVAGSAGTDAAPLKVMVMRDRAESRKTHVLVRGAWDHAGDEVEAATPSALPAETGARKDRLGLAAWIASGRNPLTARVAVNRIWQGIFGQGLVRTPENFGTQGSRPTHPELLDYLAARFVVSGWDVKGLVRLIVTSATYRESSAVSALLMERDPENVLLARGPRYRLSSAVLRDQALRAAGLLVEREGGPPVKPYHPQGVWEDVSFGRLKYQEGSGDELYRRSLYTFWRRTAPPANMFDVSLRQKCSVRVIRTNTPLQALVLMNDPTYSEAAAVLAGRVMREVDGGLQAGGVSTDVRRIARMWRLILAREPCKEELGVLNARLAAFRAYYGRHEEEALAARARGGARTAEDDPVEIASLAAVAAVILNLDEAVSRE